MDPCGWRLTVGKLGDITATSDLIANPPISSASCSRRPSSRAATRASRAAAASRPRLDVTTGAEGIAVVANLHADRPTSVPAGRAVANPVAAGSRTSGDTIRSVQFG